MSKVVKSSQIIIDEKKYVLNNEYFPKKDDEKVQKKVKEEVLHIENEEAKEDLTKEKEEMLEAVKVEKDTILTAANEEKEFIINSAYAEAENIKKSAYEEAYKEGLKEGYNKVASLIDEVFSIKEHYANEYNDAIENAMKDVTEVIIMTIEKILNKHIEEDYEMIESISKKALEKCSFARELHLRVSPEDYSFVLSMKSRILSLIEGVEDIDIKQDTALPRGSCVIDTDSGSIDSSVMTQFEYIKEKFSELLQSE